MDTSYGSFERRAPQRIVVLFYGVQHFQNPVNGFLLLVFLRLSLLGCSWGPFSRANQIVVVDKLVAIGDEQIRRGAFCTTADDSLVILLQLGDERRKIAVTGNQGEQVDVLLGIAEIKSIHDHANVGAVLAARLTLRNVDQFDAVGMKLLYGILVVAPIAIGTFVDNSAFLQQPFQDQLNLKLPGLHISNTDDQVLEIYEYGDYRFFIHR